MRKYKRLNFKFSVRSLFLALGVLCLVVILITVGITIDYKKNAKELDNESRIYVDNVLPSIFSEWNIQKLKDNSSRELLASTSDNNLKEYFFTSSKELGLMKEYKGAEGEAGLHVNIYNFIPNIFVLANYKAEVKFEKDTASVFVTLIRKKDKWEINNFHIKSTAFSKN